MKINKVQVSIVIVNYKVERELIVCINSILKSKPKVKIEIIVIDNYPQSKSSILLKEKFPQVKYIKNSQNVGFGAANNRGVKLSRGEYIFFLNPDTTVSENSIDSLFSFSKNNPSVGMVAPLLFDPSGKVYPQQGSDSYSLKSAIVASSFVNKLFPNNPISRKFFHANWDKKRVEEFDVVPGTAFMIKKNIFEKANMFDEKFFLYFEEYDLAKRIKKSGYKNYIIPQSKITHIWEASTKTRKDIKEIFFKSRYYFFKKHYGVIFASIINIISSIGKYEFMLSLILGVSVFLNLFKIGELMTFIGDQGWFYLSAKNMVTNGNIPLVGIASSRPWLHQGPLWTYLLAPFLLVFNFDPVAGVYLSIIFGMLSVIGIYLVGSNLFSRRVGLVASLLYVVSPLAVFHSRLSYHTTPIPFFTITFIFSLYKLIQNKIIYLPIAIFTLSVLYNFEIATVVLWPVLILVIIYKIFENKNYVKDIFNKKILILSSIALIVPLLPMILYDVRNGFPQTLKFAAWILYRILSFFGYNAEHAFSVEKILNIINFLSKSFSNLIFAPSYLISIIILLLALFWIIYVILKKENNIQYKLIFLSFIIPFLLIVLNQTPSSAYLPILFPTTILLVSVFFNDIFSIKKLSAFLIILTIIISGNIYFMFKNNFTFDRSNNFLTLDKRIDAANKVLDLTGNKDYNLKGVGRGSEHKSFTMNYEYLTWWLGHGPSNENENLKIYISESAKGIKVENIK